MQLPAEACSPRVSLVAGQAEGLQEVPWIRSAGEDLAVARARLVDPDR
ncbi:MAG: hypothetical protein M0Z41_13920 [Peptococcaceae bacterium]|nr:hypothetical protein [Peptococcaceae bacterium]